MEPQPLLHPNLAELYRQKVAALHERWRTRRRATKPSSLIRSLIERVVLMPVDGDLRIDLYGELAGIFGPCEHSKLPGRDRALVEKMVAGARNHLCALFVAPGPGDLGAPHGTAAGACDHLCRTFMAWSRLTDGQ
jgi:hypothetical protein